MSLYVYVCQISCHITDYLFMRVTEMLLLVVEAIIVRG